MKKSVNILGFSIGILITKQRVPTSFRVVQICSCPQKTDKLIAGTKFSDYLGLKHYEKAKNKTLHSFKVGYSASKFKY